MSKMPVVVEGSLRGAREHIHNATDHLSELLTGAPRNEWAGRIEFIYRDLAKAQAAVVEALRYWAEDDSKSALNGDDDEQTNDG